MVRKRRGGGEAVAAGPGPLGPLPLLRLLLLLLAALICGVRGSGNGYVGCLFSKNICKLEIEECYNDLAFGRCIRLDNTLSEEDLYQYNLQPQELDVLRLYLKRLDLTGYNWSHFYTQCVMQTLLEDLRYGTNSDVDDSCSQFRRNDEGPFEADRQTFDRPGMKSLSEEGPMAIVKFTPSRVNPYSKFADEVYYPPDVRQAAAAEEEEEMEEEERRKPAGAFDDYGRDYYDKMRAIGSPDGVYRRGSRSLSTKSLDPGPAVSYPKETYGLPQSYVNALQDFLEREATAYDREETDVGGAELEFLPAEKKPIGAEEAQENYEKTFSRKYKLQPKDFLGRPDEPTRDGDDDYDADEEDEDDGVEDAEDEEEPSPVAELARQAGLYSPDLTDQPFVRGALRNKDYDDLSLEALDGMLWRRDSAGFKRRERLDVKKPGPLFSTNNYAFKTQSPPASDYESNDDSEQENEIIYSPVKKEVNNKLSSNPSSKPYENVDLDHVYIQFKQELNSWSEGNKIVKVVGELLGLKTGELKGIRVGRAEVTFKVPKNSKDYNATDVVNKIDEIRNDLEKQLNIEVVRAGIGDKAKLPAMLEVSKSPDMSSSMFGGLVAAGVAAVCAAAVVLLVIARRHASSRAKLAALRTPDPEASKDYQELCRARMQAKQSDKLGESPKAFDLGRLLDSSPKAFDFGRLIESGRNSESNRSSTSSWGEEPPTSDVDVTTAHLVLSYMEDHLKNKEKLDEEWAAICAYEAEPCSTAVAEGNSDRNRTGAALPYDHSRVILNDLANPKSSDYINASTITDHDPRNPAYIATQGPLPQTTADFWQLVWEQGSLVIVMLTRLTEEGQGMCHRYWPDASCEIYHIYEVHLVSEHIWCDDYLVRSFYIKNTRTLETRTVTQFHFLSWPHNGVPKSTKALLEFRRKVNKSYRGRSCPIIVHCSDGAGRTGTYCLIDMLLNRMAKGAKDIDLAATLEHIRDQRPGMVANKQQFEFVLMAVAEEVHAILKNLPEVASEKEKPTPSSSSKQASKSDK